ncbi:RNA 3'-terminal phosphate cyclase [Rhypophila decipiens]|uniref:RNA 3'-terminal phosphate cyclase n=1 Tax=Rhypophila decipiens TaxID=261697 RepID=A0AAN6YGT5_9PEZI|nr:RNA 3'-terminal phosphate cyclase [Rhypophila decipiens]
MIELDGRTGEGGGQLVRMACALAAVVGQPIRITNVRGNRGGARGGGLKAQHVSAIEWLAKATDASVTGLSIGSHTLEFEPRNKASALKSRSFKITAESPASSTMLIFQAIFPFLLFAGGETSSSSSDTPLPINLEILGGTNVSFSLSYEYLDQVLLPALEENFVGIRVERELKSRGWSLGKSHHGHVILKIHPLSLGQPLRLRDPQHLSLNNSSTPLVERIDITILAPTTLHASLSDALTKDLDDLFPNIAINFKLVEESSSEARIYILLVALSPLIQIQDQKKDSGNQNSPQTRRHRWGRDILTSTPKKPPPKKPKKGSGAAAPPSLSEKISGQVCKDLYDEVHTTGGVVDEHLQDQLVIFQALAEGISSFPSISTSLEQSMGDLTAEDNGKEKGKKMVAQPPQLHKDNKKKTQGPFGEGSLHTTTARWVTTELLPDVTWYNDGRVCQGVGIRMEENKE